MSDTDKKIKHFIFMRFFTFEDPKYPYDIYDIVFLTKQLLFAKNNALPSLENQTNKNFEIVFMVNPKFFDNPKYEFIFSALRYATALPLKFIKPNEQSRLIRKAFDEYDFVIESRMDFDDFIFKDGVADTQNKVKECENVLAYGYCNGYTYINQEIYPWRVLFKGIGHYALLQSLIWNSSFAKNLPFMSIFYGHHRIKLVLKEFLEKNGVNFSEKMFQQNTSAKAYIYFRHEFSHNGLVSHPGNIEQIAKSRKHIEEGLTKKQLAEEFGFHLKLNSIK